MKKDLAYRIGNRYENGGEACQIYNLFMPNRRAELAMKLIDRWGMVVGKPDGEDSNGRAKLVLLSPEEVIDRATATADLAYARFEEMGWLIDLPGPDEIAAKSKEKEKF